jgi:hypothetical protein
MAEQEPNREEEILKQLQELKRRVSRLGVAVMLMILAVLLSTAAIFGQLINYFASDTLLLGAIGVGGAVAGFVLGWLAGRRS